MSYQRIVTPRIYSCIAASQRFRGRTMADIIQLRAGTLNTGSSIYDLIDSRPQARVSWDTSANATTSLVISFDLGETSDVNFIALLNCNLYTADGILRLAHDTSAITTAGGGTTITVTDAIGKITKETGAPTGDGSYVCTFSTLKKRYFAVIITENGFSSTDFELGQIMIGSYWDAPFSPDLGVKELNDLDGVKINTSAGGARHAHADWATGMEGTALPFGRPFVTENLPSIYHAHAGRRVKEMTFSRLADTVLDTSDYSSGIGTASAWRGLVSRTCGPAVPVIFQPDHTSTVVGDLMFCRMFPGEESSQAPKVKRLQCRFEEEF